MTRIAAAILLAFSGAAWAQSPAASAPFAPVASVAHDDVNEAAAVLNAHLADDVQRTMALFDVPGIAIAVV
jgi:hypothetical protein